MVREGIFRETVRADLLVIEMDIRTGRLHIGVVMANRVATERSKTYVVLRNVTRSGAVRETAFWLEEIVLVDRQISLWIQDRRFL